MSNGNALKLGHMRIIMVAAILAAMALALFFVTGNSRTAEAALTQFSYVNIAASARGTVVRINVNPPHPIVGEYRSAPDGRGKNPSRTTVDQQGSVWVGNRSEFGTVNGVAKGSVTRIGLIIGGTRVDSTGAADANGDFLQGPFTHNTCFDRHGATAVPATAPDGLIKTSRGLALILPWTNAGGADTLGGVSTAEDECIINYTRINGTGTRTVAIDTNNDVWTGGLNNQAHEKLDGSYPPSLTSGQPIAGTQFNLGCGGYGGLVDANDVLWSARNLLRADTTIIPPVPPAASCLGDGSVNDGTWKGNYGLGLDCNTGNVWYSSLGGTNRVYELDGSTGAILNSYPQGFGAQGVAVDRNSHVWVAKIFGDEVLHLAPVDPNNLALGHVVVGTVTGFAGTTGVAVDVNGFIWASEISGNSASRIDPNGGLIGGGGYNIGSKDPAVSIGAGASPYNYSDMTGLVATCITEPQGDTRRMTGGGRIPVEASFSGKEVDAKKGGGGKDKPAKASHGFTIQCDLSSGKPNNIEVNWGNGNKFHLEGKTLTSATCSDDPNIDEDNPVAGFDTFVGSGDGRYNGVSGATIDFTFTDAGEPGKNDVATIKITDADSNVVLDVSAKLENGNHQAHP